MTWILFKERFLLLVKPNNVAHLVDNIKNIKNNAFKILLREIFRKERRVAYLQKGGLSSKKWVIFRKEGWVISNWKDEV